MMTWFLKGCAKLAEWMNGFSGTVVYFMMFVTVVDVVLRFFGKPIFGSYEIISVSGAIVIGFALPKTSLERGNVSVDFLIGGASEVVQKVFFIITRVLGMGLFFGITWFLLLKGHFLYNVHEVTSILQMPRYLIVYALAFCCLVQFIALISDVIKVIHTEGEQ
jgi:TRAP-type C4-dicarboxylate transport system permease small subunit